MIIIKPKINILPLCISVICLTLLFKYPQNAVVGARNGITICLTNLFPSLFPFMALSTFILRTDALYIVSKTFGRLTNFLFKLPENAGQIILMSLIGGYPVGLKLISDSYKNGNITENEAKRLGMFCMNPGPAFTVTAIGIGIYKNSIIGLIIFISLCVSSVILGIATRFLSKKGEIAKKQDKRKPFSSDDITFSVWDAFVSMLKISAWVILFGALTACIEARYGEKGMIVCSVAEVTAGIINIAKISTIPIVTALAGFGGFCVHCQVLGYLKVSGLEYKKFFAGRLVNAALSALICNFILYYLQISLNVSYTFSESRVSAVSVSIPTIITFIFMCITIVFNIDRKKKVC